MMHPALFLLLTVLALTYALQFMITLCRLYDGGVCFKEFRAPNEFWYWLLVPILPIVLEVFERARRIGK